MKTSKQQKQLFDNISVILIVLFLSYFFLYLMICSKFIMKLEGGGGGGCFTKTLHFSLIQNYFISLQFKSSINPNSGLKLCTCLQPMFSCLARQQTINANRNKSECYYRLISCLSSGVLVNSRNRPFYSCVLSDLALNWKWE